MKNRRPLDQDFPVVSDLDLNISKGLTHAADAVVTRSIHRDYGRGLSQTVAFANSDAHSRVPFSKISPQGRATGNKNLRAPAESGQHFGINEAVSQLPRK